MNSGFLSIISISLVLCCGCATGGIGSNTGSIASVVGAKRHGLEVAETSREVVKREILDTPRSFEVSFTDDAYSWDRARFFIENYGHSTVNGRRAPVMRVNGTQLALASHPSSEDYVYEVRKERIAGKYVYTISCVPGANGDQSQARLNEGNLARFVRDGQLEVSLLQSEPA